MEMSLFKEAREMLLLNHDMKVINDEELLLLLDDNISRNPEFNYENYQRFNLDEIQEPECKAEFRFNKNDIPVLAEVLGLPETFRCSQRTVANKLEGLCMLLRRTAYPCRYSDLIPRFGRPVPELSMITNCVVDYLYDNHGHRLTQWNHQIMSPPLLQTYADAVSAQGAPLNNCFGFIDGTVRPICRPVELQEVVYNGHKRVHALKFQSLTVPSGLIANLFGLVGTFFERKLKFGYCFQQFNFTCAKFYTRLKKKGKKKKYK